MTPRQRTVVLILAASLATVFAVAGLVSLARRSNVGEAPIVVAPPTRPTEVSPTAGPDITPTGEPTTTLTPTPDTTPLDVTTTTTQRPPATAMPTTIAPTTTTTTTRPPTGTTAPPPGPGALTLRAGGIRLSPGQPEGIAFQRDPSQSFSVLAAWDGPDLTLCWGRDAGNTAAFRSEDCLPLRSGVAETVLPPDRDSRDYYIVVAAASEVRDLDLRLTWVNSSGTVPPTAEVRGDVGALGRPEGADRCGPGDNCSREFDLGHLSDLALGRVEAEATWPQPGNLALEVLQGGTSRGRAQGPAPLTVVADRRADASLWSVTVENVSAQLQPAVQVLLRFPLGVA